MLESVVADLASAALLRIGRQIEAAAKSNRDAMAAEELRASSIIGNIDFRTSPLRLAVDLPHGVTVGSISNLLSSPEMEALSFELSTLVLTGSLVPAKQRVSARWKAIVARNCPEAGDIANDLLDLLVTHYEIATEIVRDEFPNVHTRLHEDANYHRLSCVLEAIHQNLDRTGPLISPSEVERFTERYRHQLLRAHKYITPPDFDSRRDVAIDDLYVSPTITADRLNPQEGRIPVSNLLREVDRTVLLGDPGNGKSTASQVLIYRSASLPTAPIPFLIVLRDFASGGPERSVVDYLADRLSRFYQCPPPEGFVEHVLESGQALVIFDGLDELLETSHRRTVTDVVGLFCDRYPLARVLVTSRRVGYRQAPMDENQFRVLELDGFDPAQVREYVEKWFSQEDLTKEEVDTWVAAFMRESDSVDDLTRTPLLLALMCIIYRGERSLPRNRPAVYERCATMLFDKWDNSRGIHADLRAGQLVDPALKYLAYWLFSADAGDGVTESALVKEATAYLHERLFDLESEAENAAREFVEFCRGRAWVFSDVGTTPDGESLYKFTHRTFMEYFAAYHLSRTTDTPEKLARLIARKVADMEWDVVAQLAVQITDRHSDRGANRIFEVLIRESGRRSARKRANILTFLARCLPFAQISPPVLRRLVREALATVVVVEIQPAGYEPISELLRNSHFVDEELIEGELRERLEYYIGGDDEGLADVALSIIVLSDWITEGRLSGWDGSEIGDGDTGHDSVPRWRSFFAGLRNEFKDIYLDASARNIEVARYCLMRRWMSLSEYLELFGRGLDPILQEIPMRAFFADNGWTSYASGLLLSAVSKETAWRIHGREREDLVEQLSEVADYAEGSLRRGEPLWTPGIRFINADLDALKQGDELGPQLTDRQLLGAGIIIACFLEQSPNYSQALKEWGRLGPLVEWLGRHDDSREEGPSERWSRDSKFAVLQRWVRGQISYAAMP